MTFESHMWLAKTIRHLDEPLRRRCGLKWQLRDLLGGKGVDGSPRLLLYKGTWLKR